MPVFANMGCRTAELLEQAENQQMQSVVGLTMAGFSAQSGLTAMGVYDVGGGGICVVLGRTVTLVTPGSYGTTGAPESWQIVGVSYSGRARECTDLTSFGQSILAASWSDQRFVFRIAREHRQPPQPGY